MYGMYVRCRVALKSLPARGNVLNIECQVSFALPSVLHILHIFYISYHLIWNKEKFGIISTGYGSHIAKGFSFKFVQFQVHTQNHVVFCTAVRLWEKLGHSWWSLSCLLNVMSFITRKCLLPPLIANSTHISPLRYPLYTLQSDRCPTLQHN